jgi:CTP synthase (UTP-ammonia lyase)
MRIALIGEYTPSFEPHTLTNDALEHAASSLGISCETQWVSTADIQPDTADQYDGFWIAPGSPYKDMNRTLELIQRLRLRSIPCLGTCGGFQHMIIEYARNALGYRDAQHAEYDPYSSDLIISRLACSLVGREMRLTFSPDSATAACYGNTSATEQYYCNFGVNPDKVDFIGTGEFRVVGSDAEGDVRVMELPGHPFFVGTLYVPQAKSRPDSPHPLITAFLQAIRTRVLDPLTPEPG